MTMTIRKYAIVASLTLCTASYFKFHTWYFRWMAYFFTLFASFPLLLACSMNSLAPRLAFI